MLTPQEIRQVDDTGGFGFHHGAHDIVKLRHIAPHDLGRRGGTSAARRVSRVYRALPANARHGPATGPGLPHRRGPATDTTGSESCRSATPGAEAYAGPG